MKEGLRVTEHTVSEIGDSSSKRLAAATFRCAAFAGRSQRRKSEVALHDSGRQERDQGLVLPCGRRTQGWCHPSNREDRESGITRCSLADLLIGEGRSQRRRGVALRRPWLPRDRGVSIFEVLGIPRAIRQILMCWKPYSRRYPACPFFFFKAKQREFHAILAAEDAWYATPLTSDTTLMP